MENTPKIKVEQVSKGENLIAILGMHRSGTSLFASWLNACGVSIGDDLVGEPGTNRRGHSEDLDFLKVHKSFLEKLQRDDSAIIDSSKINCDQSMKDDIVELINRKRNGKPAKTVVWKDPRTVLLIDTYIELFPNLKSLIIYRPYWEVVDSLYRRRISNKLQVSSKSNVISKLREKLYIKKHQAQLKELKKSYLTAWISYNSILIDLKKSNSNCLMFSLQEFKENQVPILEKLQLWNVPYKESSFSSIYNAKLIKQQALDLGINDNDLISKADKILSELNNLSDLKR
jgi:hypothetical protein